MIKYLIPILLLLFAANQSFAQKNLAYIDTSLAINTGALKGFVIDEESQGGIPYANITLVVNGKVCGTQTDFDGYFEIYPIPVGKYDIKCSFIGYEEQNIADILIDNQKITNLNVSLIEASDLLEVVEVISISCGLISRSDKTSTGMTARFDKMGRVKEQFHGSGRW